MAYDNKFGHPAVAFVIGSTFPLLIYSLAETTKHYVNASGRSVSMKRERTDKTYPMSLSTLDIHWSKVTARMPPGFSSSI